MANWSEVLSSLENLQENEKAKIMKVLNRFFYKIGSYYKSWLFKEI